MAIPQRRAGVSSVSVTVPWCEIASNFDVVFWMGSLNYEVDGTRDEFKQALAGKDNTDNTDNADNSDNADNAGRDNTSKGNPWETLSCRDTFVNEHVEAGVLHNYKRGVHDFPPTYPLMSDLECIKAGLSLFDPAGNRRYQAEGAGPREPRWSDRILWHTTPGTNGTIMVLMVLTNCPTAGTTVLLVPLGHTTPVTNGSGVGLRP